MSNPSPRRRATIRALAASVCCRRDQDLRHGVRHGTRRYTRPPRRRTVGARLDPGGSLLNPKFFRNGIVMLVLVVGTAALLFTWINASAQPTQPIGYSQFLTDVTAGKVTKVVQQGETLTVTPVNDRARPTRSSSRASCTEVYPTTCSPRPRPAA